MKVHLYVPAEGTAPAANAVQKMKIVPVVGDLLYTVVLAPDAGPGAGDFLFEVVARTWYPDGPHLHLKRRREA